MKKATIILLALQAAACTHISGDGQRFAYTSLGGDTTGLAISARGATAERVETSPSFRETASMVRWAVVAAATQGIVGDLSTAWRSVSATKEATKAAAIRSAADVEKAKIAADVTKATFEPIPTP